MALLRLVASAFLLLLIAVLYEPTSDDLVGGERRHGDKLFFGTVMSSSSYPDIAARRITYTHQPVYEEFRFRRSR